MNLDDLEMLYRTQYERNYINEEEDTGYVVLNFLNWVRKNIKFE